jgi:hypothetical protein
MWRRWPDSNIGIATGHAFDAIDLDGAAALDALDAAEPDAPALVGPIVCTGREDGVQIYVQVSGAGNRSGMLVKTDYRGAGGYVIAPPSVHHLGVTYEWSMECGPPATPLQPLPQWLRDIVFWRNESRHTPPGVRSIVEPAHGYGVKALEGEVGRLAVVGVGSRNDELNRSAFRMGQLVGSGRLDAERAAGDLLTVALRIGLGEREAVATIRSGLANGIAQPRQTAA